MEDWEIFGLYPGESQINILETCVDVKVSCVDQIETSINPGYMHCLKVFCYTSQIKHIFRLCSSIKYPYSPHGRDRNFLGGEGLGGMDIFWNIYTLDENVSRVVGQKSLTPWDKQNSLTP